MLNFDEKMLKNNGFNMLQEKENMIYYEKFSENEGQIFVIYDKMNQRVKSIDTYSFDNNEMKINQKKILIS